MKDLIKPCLERHLPDKAKPGNKIAAETWFTAAEAHIKTATLVLDDDANGSMLLGWAAMHKTAKGVAALGGCRLENETHGKIVDFLCCVFAELTDSEKGLVRAASTGRNAGSYDDPTSTDPYLCQQVITLATRLLAGARAGELPAAAKKRIPPPPSS